MSFQTSRLRFHHQLANSPHSWAAWACFFLADAWLVPDAVFFCMRRRETVWRYGWVDFRSGVCIFMDTDTLLYSLLIVFVAKENVCVCGKELEYILPICPLRDPDRYNV
jgi:hypothetical protein